MPHTDIITIRDLAVYLKTAEKTLYRLAAEGSIPGFKVGGSWRFRREEIDNWIRKQEREATTNKQTAKSEQKHRS